MTPDFDLGIIGSGFAGSLMALISRKLGYSVALIEQGRHPRFAIGESSTPLANLLWEELARRYDLPQIAAFSKWGSWQAAHPQIACGLKRGFTFYHHQTGRAWPDEPDRSNQLLVAASPHDAVADTHWYRPDFDHHLVREAMALGAEYLDEAKLRGATMNEWGLELSGERAGSPFTLRARFVIDASGPRGFLHRALDLPSSPFPGLPATQALYTHFTGVHRWEDLHPNPVTPPYPVDDAAMHHVCADGWIWVLRFNNGITSAGMAATPAAAEKWRFAEGGPAWNRVLADLPSVREQFSDAQATMPFRHGPELAFRSGTVTGTRWALLPSAAGFVDPLLSTGFPLTLLGIERLAGILEKGLEHGSLPESLRHYGRQTLADVDRTAELIAALYANMADFEVFAALTQLYFAAAIFSETRRRLGHADGSFLLREDQSFGPASRRCLELAGRGVSKLDRNALLKLIAQTIGPINLASLGDPGRRNWYPCLAEDLLAAAPKLRVTRGDIEQLLARCGF